MCGIWAIKAGDFVATEFDGSSSGLSDALAYVGANGLVTMYPGCGSISIPSVPAGVTLLKYDGGVANVYGPQRQFTIAGASSSAVINAAEYDTIQHAIDAAPVWGGSGADLHRGATVLLPPGLFDNTTVPAMGPLVIPDGVTLRGAGGTHFPTWLHLPASYKNSDMVTIQGNYASLENLAIQHCNDASGSGRGVVWGKSGSVLQGLKMSGVYVLQSPGNAFRALGTDDAANTWEIEAQFDKCRFSDSKNGGCASFGDNCTTFSLHDSLIENIVGYGIKLGINLHTVMSNVVFEGGNDDTNSFLRSVTGGVRGLLLDGCYFEHVPTGGNTNWFIQLDGISHGVHVERTTFVRATGSVLRAFKANGSGGSACRYARLSYCTGIITGAAPTGTEDVVTVSVNDIIDVERCFGYRDDYSGERAFTNSGGGTTNNVTVP